MLYNGIHTHQQSIAPRTGQPTTFAYSRARHCWTQPPHTGSQAVVGGGYLVEEDVGVLAPALGVSTSGVQGRHECRAVYRLWYIRR